MLVTRSKAVYLLSLLTVSLNLTWASTPRSNLDASEPIVRTSPALDEDDFGFTLVLHQVEEPVAGDFDSFISSTR